MCVYVCVCVRAGVCSGSLCILDRARSSRNTRLDLLWVRFGSAFSFEISNFFIRGNGILCVLRCVLHTEWLNNTSSSPSRLAPPPLRSAPLPNLLVNRTNNIKNEKIVAFSMFSCSFSGFGVTLPIHTLPICARNSCYACVRGRFCASVFCACLNVCMLNLDADIL